MNQMLKLGGENISNMTGVLNLDPTHDDIEVGIRVRFLLGIRILRENWRESGTIYQVLNTERIYHRSTFLQLPQSIFYDGYVVNNNGDKALKVFRIYRVLYYVWFYCTVNYKVGRNIMDTR